VLDDWIGAGSGPASPVWTAAIECGGNDALASAAKSVRASGHLLGLELDLAQLASSGSAGAGGPWDAALRFARDDEGFEELRDLCAPELVLLDAGNAGEPRDAGGTRPAFALPSPAHTALADHAARVFGLWAERPSLIDGARLGVLVDGALDEKTAAPSSGDLFPLTVAAFADAARFTVSPEHALGPNDAAAFLAHLVLGQTPTYAIPRGGYPEHDDHDDGVAAPGPEGLYARAGGWSEGRGLSDRDVFIKNTWEVASWLARTGARERLTSHRFLTGDRRVEESWFGPDLRVVVNYGPSDFEDESTDTVLPQHGFLVRHPFFFAFCASKANGVDYDPPALFTVRSLEGKMYLRAESVRIWHGFGRREIRIGGKLFEVDGELRTRIW